jgi:hypothetical protein
VDGLVLQLHNRLDVLARDLGVCQITNLLQAVGWYAFGAHNGVRRLLQRVVVLCPVLPVTLVPIGWMCTKNRSNRFPRVVQSIAVLRGSIGPIPLLEALIARVSQAVIHMRLTLGQVGRVICDLLLIDPPPPILTFGAVNQYEDRWRSEALIRCLLQRFDTSEAQAIVNTGWRIISDFIWICNILHCHRQPIPARVTILLEAFCNREDPTGVVPLSVLASSIGSLICCQRPAANDFLVHGGDSDTFTEHMERNRQTSR